jgi:hypothetical protein
MEPFLSALHRYLPGITIGQIKEQAEAYMDDVDTVGQQVADLRFIDCLSRLFEAMSGQILNRNRKSAILGLGSWAGRQDWPLRWLSSPPTLRVFGVHFAPSLALTITASWEACCRGVMAAIHFWSGRRLPTLRLKRDALETFVFSKIWYLCQILPLPAAVAQRLAAAAGAYLWRGHLERLAWQELHSPLAEGGLALSCLQSRAQALLAKQFCWAVGNEGEAAAHWAFWLGGHLGVALPALAGTPQAPSTPPVWLELAGVVEELLEFETVTPAALLAATSKEIYSVFMETPPPPKVVLKRPATCWPDVWKRLWQPRPFLEEEMDVAFKLIHNILPVRGRLARFGQRVAASCPVCPGTDETVLHLFISCPRIAPLWQQFLASILVHTGLQTDEDLLFLAWPPVARDSDLAVAVISYHHLVWSSRTAARPPTFVALTAVLRAKPAPFLPLW